MMVPDNCLKIFFLTCLLIIIFVVPTAALENKAQDVIQQTGDGILNWTKGLITATGSSSPSDKKNKNQQSVVLAIAKARAVKNLLAVIMSIQLSNYNTVGDFAKDNDIFLNKLYEMGSRAKVISQEYLSDATVKVKIQISLFGGLSQFVLPNEIKQVEAIKPVTGSRPADSDSSGNTFSGLIVDATGLGCKPAMVPLLFDENGKIVFGPAFVSREFVVQHGMARYLSGSLSNQSDAGAGNNPLLIKGLSVQGPKNINIIISNTAAAQLLGASRHLLFLKQCRVIIII